MVKFALGIAFFLLAYAPIGNAFTLPIEADFHGEITINGGLASFTSTTTTTAVNTPFGNAQRTIRIAENATLKHTLTLLKLSSPADTYIATHQIDFKQNGITLNQIKGFTLALPRSTGTRLAYGPADNTVYQNEDYLDILAVDGYNKTGKMIFGGVPFNDVWNADGGLYVGVLADKPDIFELPLSVSGSDIHLGHIYSPDATIGSQAVFNAGDSLTLPPIMVGLHQGDYFSPLREYVKALEIQTGKSYIDVPLGNTNARDPYWKTWGLDPTVNGEFTLDEVRNIANTLEQRGIFRIMLDYGWFVTEGIWDVNTDPKPGFDSNSDLTDFIAELNARGFEVGLWYQPLQVDPDDDDVQNNLLQYAIQDADNDIYEDDDDVALLDPSNPNVLTLISNQLASFQAMGVDHVYIDSQIALLATPPNHTLARPLYSHEGLTGLYDLLRTKGEDLNMTIEICPDGRSQTLLNMPQAVTNIGDPKNDRQLRAEHRWLKAIQGSRAIIGTYVEPFDDNPVSGSFLNIIGIGGNIQSLGNATNLGRSEWNTWLEFQKRHQLVTADYLPLYDIGFDYPEGHVLRHGNQTFYAFFAKTEATQVCLLADCSVENVTLVTAEVAEGSDVDESVDLLGLEPNTQYRITSFSPTELTPAIHQLITTDSDGDAAINLAFNKEILLVATKIIAGDATGDGEVDIRDVVATISIVLGTMTALGFGENCNSIGGIDLAEMLCTADLILLP